jgi:hypothetical protein
MSEGTIENQAGGKPNYKLCSALNASGQPCAAPARQGRAYCLFHDPAADTRDLLAAARRLGGKAHAATLNPVDLPMDLSTADGVLAMLSALGGALKDGRIDRGRAAELRLLGVGILEVHRNVKIAQQIAEIRAAVAALREVSDDET